MSSIFVSISAYHDYELPKTMVSAIENSSGINDIHFGISLVYYENNDIEFPEYPNAKYVFSKAPENTGVNVGRNISNSLYGGQDFFLQVDSHSRFAENWDQAMIGDIKFYEHLGFKKPAITCYPAQYWYNEKGEEVIDSIAEPQNIEIEDEKLFQETLKVVNVGKENYTIFQKSIAGGFLFTRGMIPKLTDKIAFSEEFPLGASLYTNGFDLLIPRSLPVYHYYSGPSETDPLAHNRRHVWADPRFNEYLMGMVYSTNDEIFKMFSENICDSEHLGSDRTLQEYGEYAGLDFINRRFI